ncbi:MAG: SAM-dependent methyltransferase [Prevotella sp.]|nr:SAM-dependent methyltransferase [Prevotella sp.]
MANAEMKNVCGIYHFFVDKEDFSISSLSSNKKREDKGEYGDWQTNMKLSLSICKLLKEQGLRPKVIIEPTCGRGNFILAAIQTFESIEEIYGIEIYKPYIDDLKMRLLQYSIDNKNGEKAYKYLYNEDVFSFDFQSIKHRLDGRETLIIGNPPWVTNSKLGIIKSKNTPQKSNYKHIKGLDAITGKGNFDIAEYICSKMINVFSDEKVHFAMLLKNSVIRNIVYEQIKNNSHINAIYQYEIDAKKEFNASVSASLLRLEFGIPISKSCHVSDFYTLCPKQDYGWINDNFVADVATYNKNQYIDGISPFQWRSGIKHDCYKIMELTLDGNKLVNGLGKTIDIEDEAIYPLVKSSDIKEACITSTRKYVIVTQHSTSEGTEWMMKKCPKTYDYLLEYAEMLDKRGSSIYLKRPRFSLFGIGDYSFKKYKVVISGLYKHSRFSLVEPINGKPVMVDDTCYLLGFDIKDYAVITLKILNSQPVRSFIQSLSFKDAKRIINKELLMRIDLYNAAIHIGYEMLGINRIDFDEYINFLKKNKTPKQGYLFE